MNKGQKLCMWLQNNERLRIGCFLERVQSLLHDTTPVCQTAFPKGSLRWHNSVCVRVCARVLFPCTRRWGSSVTWQLIPRGCHDNYSCQAITKATGVILAQLVTPSNLWPLYKHSHTQRGWENARGTSVSRQACLEGCSWVLSHVFTISDFYVFWASRLLLLPRTEGVKDVKSASRWDYQFNF